MFTSVRYAEKRRWRSWTRIALVVLVVAVAAAVVVSVLWVYAAMRISGVPVSDLARADDGAENALVVASDQSDAPGAIAIVQTAERRDAPAVLLLPRELLVDAEGRGTRPLREFYEEGGIAVLVDAVQGYTGIPLDHYVVVDVDALGDLVETMGGLPVCDIPGSEGCRVLSGTAVVGQLAASAAPSDDDPRRVLAVEPLLRNGLHELTRWDVLWNPFRAKRLVDGYVRAVETDRDLGPGRLRSLAGDIGTFPPGRLEVRVVPGVREDGAVRAALEPAESLFQAFRELEPLPETGFEAPVELLPADVTVRVLNGIGRSGVAAQMAGFLQSKGFVIESTDNAPAFDPNARTVVRHAEGAADRAELVAGFLPEVTAVEAGRLPEGVDVVVVVGADWSTP